MGKESIACIVWSRGKILVAHRNPSGQMGGRWEFPGGKVEPGESHEEALVREFHEEFGVKVKTGPLVAKSSFSHNGENVDLFAYRVYVPHRGIFFKYHLTEHTEYKWVAIDDVKNLSFVDSDMLLYDDVRNYLLNV